MSLFYDFYSNPPKEGSNRKPRLHARVVPNGTIDSSLMAKYIHGKSTLTEGDVEAALVMFRKEMVEQLLSGYRVHWEGVGYFELTLSCPPVRTEKEIRSESVRLKTITFRPEKGFKKEFTNIHAVRKPDKRHSSTCSEIEADGLLTGFFMDNDYITSRQFRQLCGFTRSTATRRLKYLTAAGKLLKTGHNRSPLYLPAKGFYRR